MKAAKPAPLAIHGWTVFAHPLFMTQVEALVAQVEALKKKDPTGYVKKNATKRAARLKLGQTEGSANLRSHGSK